MSIVHMNYVNDSFAEHKDRKRIQELISAAMWDRRNMIKLAVKMAKLITRYDKASRRALASEEILGKHNIVTIIFNSRAQELKNS